MRHFAYKNTYNEAIFDFDKKKWFRKKRFIGYIPFKVSRDDVYGRVQSEHIEPVTPEMLLPVHG